MENEISVDSKSTLVAKKFRLVQIRIKAHKKAFEMSDLLSKMGPFPAVESYLEDRLRQAAEEYLELAKEMIEKASKQELKTKKETRI